MKNKLFLCAAVFTACAFSMKLQAQLEVTSAGNVIASKKVRIADNVAIGTNLDDHTFLNLEYSCPAGSSPSTYYGIKSHIIPPSAIPTSPVYGIYGFADAFSSTYLVPDLPLVGVMGVALKSYSAPTTFAAGIVGMAHFYGGIGVYGGISASPTTAPSSMASGEKYAGYFSGTTKVNGTLLTNMLVLNGDTINVNHTRGIPTDAANSLTQLHPISYSFKPDSTLKYDEKLQREMEGTHYGLIAQDVQRVLPELVYEREGCLSINYIEMIPLLIMKVQELSAEIEKLQQEKAEKTYQQAPATNTLSGQAVLYQNVPNPFSADTKIAYQLPENTRSASLYIYNMNGLQVAEYPISLFGDGAIIVSAGSLEAGMYLYSLTVDGEIVDTKRMILTK